MLYIIFGSRTGNAKSVALLAKDYANHMGFDVVCEDMQEFEFGRLPSIENLLVVVSTHGEGEPPVQAEAFYEYIHGDGFKNIKARYAVLGLGDSSYRYYCQTGKDIDKRFELLGGERLQEVGSCDIDFEEAAKKWVKNAVEAFTPFIPVKHPPAKGNFIFELRENAGADKTYKAELLEKRWLTIDGSSKKVLHVSLSTKGAGMDYFPGDAIGLYATNSRLFVDELLRGLGFDKAYPVKAKTGVRLLKDVLIHDYELTLLTPLVIEKYAQVTNSQEVKKLLDDEEKLREYVKWHDIFDLVTQFPSNLSVEQFLSILRKLNPRLYSVASSREYGDDMVDITVKVIQNEGQQRVRHGVCSSFLWHRLEVGDKVPIALEPIEKFRLPDDGNIPIIMVGAGTGIAPFRGFLQERKVKQDKGKNWLFFGERNQATDFLYKEEIKQFQKDGVIHKLSLAFSRDQNEKNYVTHLIEQESAEIMEWVKMGAIVYVCGSKDRLGKSTRESMIRIFEKELQLDKNRAEEYFTQLKDTKHYLEEIY